MNSRFNFCWLPRGSWTAAYVGMVVLINWLFLVVPMVPVFGTMFPPVMLVVGFVFVFRDFAQREIGHFVIIAMLVAGALSYWTSSPYVAVASVTAFLISEVVDWGVYSFTKRSLSERILWSSVLAVPVDTIVFLQLVDHFDWTGFALVCAAKLVAAVCFWLVLRRREQSSGLSASSMGA